MSSLSQRPRSIWRQRSLQNGIARLCCGSNFLRHVGQLTRGIVESPSFARRAAYFSDDFDFVDLSPERLSLLGEALGLWELFSGEGLLSPLAEPDSALAAFL